MVLSIFCILMQQERHHALANTTSIPVFILHSQIISLKLSLSLYLTVLQPANQLKQWYRLCWTHNQILLHMYIQMAQACTMLTV